MVHLAKETFERTAQAKRKTIQKKDIGMKKTNMFIVHFQSYVSCGQCGSVLEVPCPIYCYITDTNSAI